MVAMAGKPFATLSEPNHLTGRRPCYLEKQMLKWAIIFFVVSLITGFFGFSGVSAATAGIAKILFYIAIVIFLVFLVMALFGGAVVL